MMSARKRATHCRRAQRGLAAVEFALILPILLMMFLGLIEFSHALGVRAEVINMSSAGGDLVAQKSTASGADLDTVFSAVSAMLFPNNISQATVTISSVIDGGTGNPPRVAWSCSKGLAPAALAKGSTPSLPAIPAGFIVAGKGGSVIWSRVTYRYNSFLAYYLPAWTTWTNDFYLKPRRVPQIPITSSATAPAVCNI